MRLDHDLLRLLLIAAAEGDEAVTLDGYSHEYTGYHRCQLINGGLAIGPCLQQIESAYPIGIIDELTYKGHEVLDTIRPYEVWSQVQDLVRRAVGSASFETKVKLAEVIISERAAGADSTRDSR